MQRIRRISSYIFALLLSVGAFVVSHPAFAQVQTGLEATAKSAFGGASLQSDPAVIIGALMKTVLSYVGIIFMALVVYGGILWMFAAGNDQKVEKAKSILTSAVIGLVIISAGYAITSFVLTQLQANIFTAPAA